MAPMSFQASVQKPLHESGFNIVVDDIWDNTKATRKSRGVQSFHDKGPSISKKSQNVSERSDNSGSPVRPQWATLPLDSLPDEKRSDFAALLDPRNLSWSSSTARTWNRSSPVSDSAVSDLPETPPRLSYTPSPGKTWTPLTPPTPPSPSVGRRPNSKITMKRVPSSYFDDNLISSDLNGDWQDEDEIQPGKLFRNCTLELEKISKANVAAAKIKYNKEPSFAFSNESQAISSRTRSQTSKAIPPREPEIPKEVTEASKTFVNPSVSGSKLPSFLELILSFNMYKRMDDSPNTCIASLVKDSYTQCDKKFRGSLKDARTIAGKFARCKKEKDYHAMIAEIEKVVRQAMCGTHQNVVFAENNDGARINELRGILCRIEDLSEADRQALEQWLDTISDSNASIDHIPPVCSPSTATVSTTPHPESPEPSRTAPKPEKRMVQLSYWSSFTPFQLKRTQGVSVSAALACELKAPLRKNEIDPGFIYIFWDRQHFGKLKIGRTKNIKKRLEQWNKQCGRTHSYLSEDNRSRTKMPHVGRVETLIHTELKELRRKRKCEGCGRKHQEWFDEGEVHAVKVAEKWQEWMMQNPYVRNELGEWVLRPEMLETLDQVCEPLARDKVEVTRPRKSEGAKRSSRKKGGRKTM